MTIDSKTNDANRPQTITIESQIRIKGRQGLK